MSQTLGIDFGTSNSAAGISINGRPCLIEVEAGENTLPTAVFFDFENQKTLFGRQAERALINGDDGRYMRALKSILGTPLMHESRIMMGERVTFVDIIARFLRRIKSRAQEVCYQDFDHALSGRPVLFHSNDPARNEQALKDLTLCYLAAGFKSVEFMPEPEAAALAARHKGDGLKLIVDIGGGTSDFTVFQNTATGIDILASHGVRLGGTNFDRSISFDHVMHHFGKDSEIRKDFGAGTHAAPRAIFHDLATWQMIPFLYTSEVKRKVSDLQRNAVDQQAYTRLMSVLEDHLGHDVAFAVERGKIQVNTDGEGMVNLTTVERGLNQALSVNMLTTSLTPHMENLAAAVGEALTLANCSADQIESVIFVGGSSLIKDVSRTVQHILPKATLHYNDAFTAIIDGLALASARPR
ncbi:Hsp70 family protein [Halocynthiibacter namhaensis]|uniref:Hsp70 family protein n=1 Tax=Halocynthiibacter namhaensis TaxID=1290553 RepID=UPI0005793D53|nr:Hsp70 family protein [Halocynthiibacter namhaensis]